MRLHAYLDEELSRLPARFTRARTDGGDEAAMVYLRKQLTMMELVLDGAAPLARLDPPGTVGDARWDALISSALIHVVGDVMMPAQPLQRPWFPNGEVGADREPAIAATPPPLAAANVFIRATDLRWQRPTDQL